MPIFLLSSENVFPPPHLSTKEGLVAIGGDLSPQRLLAAYRVGIFPWYSENEPILWWSPDPRMVLFPNELKTSRSLAKVIRQGRFQVTVDTCFECVIAACARTGSRKSEGTWIDSKMEQAYVRLHHMGYAHSVEAWCDGGLAGGLYGVSLGGCFFGESMFSAISNASKTALAYLCNFLEARDFDLIDCQVRTAHLESLGARMISRAQFLDRLKKTLRKPSLIGKWAPMALVQ